MLISATVLPDLLGPRKIPVHEGCLLLYSAVGNSLIFPMTLLTVEAAISFSPCRGQYAFANCHSDFAPAPPASRQPSSSTGQRRPGREEVTAAPPASATSQVDDDEVGRVRLQHRDAYFRESMEVTKRHEDVQMRTADTTCSAAWPPTPRSSADPLRRTG